jgi:hypothetical protein
MDQSEFTWESTPYTDAGPSQSAGRRSPWGVGVVAVLRGIALLVIATLAILVLLPAAIAAQAAFAV